MLRIRSRTLLPVCAPPVHDAAILVRDGRVVAAGAHRQVDSPGGARLVDLGERAVLPGLVNAHCHLDFTMMRGGLLRPARFSEWILRINAMKRGLGLDDFRRAVRDGLAEAHATGTTTLVNIESFPELLVDLPVTPVRVWWCLEMMDIRNRLAGPDFGVGCLRVFEPGGAGRHRFGLSPHATYTVSPELFRAAGEAARRCGLLFTTHVSESAEEIEMFERRSGGLHALIDAMREDGGQPSGRTPLGHLAGLDLIPAQALLVHMNGLSAGDLEWLAREAGGRRLSIAHCPQSHAFFGHPEFSAAALARAGVNLCLGTDSLASAPSLNMFDEMEVFARSHPESRPSEILAMATWNGAKALDCGDWLGHVRAGSAADLVAIPDEPVDGDPHSVILRRRSRAMVVPVHDIEAGARVEWPEDSG